MSRCAGMILLRTTGNRILIDCNILEPTDVLWLIRLIRSRLPESIQTGWPLFAYRVAVPVREGTLDKRRLDGPDDVYVTRLRWDFFFVCAILVVGLGGILLSWLLQQPVTLLAPLVPTLFWIFGRRRMPTVARKSLDLREVADRSFLGLLVILSVITLGSFWLFGAFKISWVPFLPSMLWIGGFVMICCLIGGEQCFERLRRRHDLEFNALPAAERWEAGERFGSR